MRIMINAPFNRMFTFLGLALVSLGAVPIRQCPTPSFEVADYDLRDVIVRDVAVIGGGASGTYAAVRLQQDLNRSVVVVERKMTLGGHTETYHDPGSGTTIDIGVIAFHDLPLTRQFFARYDIPLTRMFFAPRSAITMDFRTGRRVNVPYDADAVDGA